MVSVQEFRELLGELAEGRSDEELREEMRITEQALDIAHDCTRRALRKKREERAQEGL